jgi:hypothetical protein
VHAANVHRRAAAQHLPLYTGLAKLRHGRHLPKKCAAPVR